MNKRARILSQNQLCFFNFHPKKETYYDRDLFCKILTCFQKRERYYYSPSKSRRNWFTFIEGCCIDNFYGHLDQFSEIWTGWGRWLSLDQTNLNIFHWIPIMLQALFCKINSDMISKKLIRYWCLILVISMTKITERYNKAKDEHHHILNPTMEVEVPFFKFP